MNVLQPYQVQRLTGFVNPSHDPRNATYQVNQSLIAIGSGEKTGRGVDHATQTYRLWINAEEVKDAAFMKGPKNYEGSEIPAAMESITFGWWNYQQAGPKGFVAWIDDIALSKERLGVRGIPVAKGKKS